MPCDVRPPPVLFKTLDYLFHDIIDQFGLQQSHGFVRDRARAIRNDLVLQNYRGVEAVILHERIARYHIMCSNILCGVEGFVMQQEVEQLRKTLLSLIEYYSEMQRKGINMPNEAEFQAYYILTFPWNNDILSRLESDLSEKVFFDPKVQLAIEVRSLMTRRNDKKRPCVDGSLNHYSKIFEIIRSNTTPYLFGCCVHLHFADIRRGAIRAMQRSFTYQGDNPLSGILLQDIVDSLGFDGESDCIAFLNHYFIEVEPCQKDKFAYVGRKVVDMNGKKEKLYPRYPYSIIPDNLPSTKSNFVEAKRQGLTYFDVLDGKYSHVVQKIPHINLPGFVSPVKAHAKSPIISTLKKSPLFKSDAFGSPVNGFRSSSRKGTSFVSQSNAINQATSIGSVFSKPSPNVNPPSSILAAGMYPVTGGQPLINSGQTQASCQLQESITGTLFKVNEHPAPPVSHFVSKMESILPVRQLQVHQVKNTVPVQFANQEHMFTLKSTSFLPNPPATQVISNFSEHAVKQSIVLSQKKISLAKSRADQEAYVDELIKEELKSMLIPIIDNVMKKSQMVPFIDHIAEQFIYDYVKEIVHERLITMRQLSEFRSAMDQYANQIFLEVVQEFVIDSTNEELYQVSRMHSLQRFGFDRWRFIVRYKSYLVQKKQFLAQRMVSFLRQAALVPHLSIPPAPVRLVIKDEQIESQLLRLSNEVKVIKVDV
jgi:hypothetical protein